MNTRKVLSGFCVITALLWGAGCANISSSELKSTKAKDLKVTATVEETQGLDQVQVRTLMETIPDDVGIQFNQGEILQASAEQADGTLQPSVNLSYDSNFLNVGEQYVTSISKAPLGKNYILTYTDADKIVTTCRFASQGVPELLTPNEDQEVIRGETVELTWTPQNLGAMTVTVDYQTKDGGSGWTELSTSDTGSFKLDLSRDAFLTAATGEMKIALKHGTTYSQMSGFGAADVQVVSASKRTIILKEKAGSAQ